MVAEPRVFYDASVRISWFLSVIKENKCSTCVLCC